MALTEKALLNSDNQQQLAITRQELFNARHLPGWMYTSPEIYALEIERIFMKSWLCGGRVEEFATPGAYQALRIAGEPLLVCKDGSGQLNAFSNLCQHRGVEVVKGQGTAEEFMCPYHGWLYGLNGRLIGAPLTKEVTGFDFKNCRLPPLKLDTWADIFLSISIQTASRSRRSWTKTMCVSSPRS